MNTVLTHLMAILFLIAIASTGYADQNPAQDVARNCKVEFDTYCKDVTPGGGRILACLYAHSDKLSDRCRDVVSDATEQIKIMGAAISFVKSECGEDLEQFCKDVHPGEGRLMNCLEKNDAKISQKCRLALKDVGLKE